MQSAERCGIQHLGIGSDLCQHQPDSVVTWMRNGRWAKTLDYGEGSIDAPQASPPCPWYQDNRHFPHLAEGLAKIGFHDEHMNAILGDNWYHFYAENFGPAL